MPCSCHGRKGESVSVAKPYDQCVLCARKHVKDAWGAYNEFTYEEDNRDYISDQLRKAADHLKTEHRDLALHCRDMAMVIEENRDSEMPDMSFQLAMMKDALRDVFYAEHEDVRKRLESLKRPVDMIIPLGSGSHAENAEIRMLLRSVEKNLRNVGRIFVVTDNPPSWLQNVIVVSVPDSHPTNKDANLHDKVLAVLKRYDVDDFIFASDDNAIMQPVNAASIPVLENHRPRADFFGEGVTKWRNRVANTFLFADSKNIRLEHHFECHAPQLFHGKMLLEGMRDVDYASQPGLTIYTTWRIVTGTTENAKMQSDWKLTFENECTERLAGMTDSDLCSKLFLGYNDGFVVAGGIDRLRRIFSFKSKFEKEGL